eukprot:1160609-Pelagomonas_calceolata.AAC.7
MEKRARQFLTESASQSTHLLEHLHIGPAEMLRAAAKFWWPGCRRPNAPTTCDLHPPCDL